MSFKKNSLEESLLTKRDVAKMLGLSIFTIDKWVVERKNLPFIKLGTRVMFRITDVEEYLDQNRYEPIREINGQG